MVFPTHFSDVLCVFQNEKAFVFLVFVSIQKNKQNKIQSSTWRQAESCPRQVSYFLRYGLQSSRTRFLFLGPMACAAVLLTLNLQTTECSLLVLFSRLGFNGDSTSYLAPTYQPANRRKENIQKQTFNYTTMTRQNKPRNQKRRDNHHQVYRIVNL